MFRIGDFSRIARVSARLLRFYDEIGLLEPAHTDPQTGYRFYTLAQLSTLNRITVLKELGFNLDQIRPILQSAVGAAELRAMLLLRRTDAERALAAEAQRLRHIQTRIAQIENEGHLSSEDVIVRAEPTRTLLSMRRTVASFADARDTVGELRALAAPLLLRRPGCALVVVAHSLQYEHEELDLEFGFAVDAAAPEFQSAVGTLTVSLLPAVARMAVCVRSGPPDEAHLVTARIGHFLEQNGERLAGPSREVFLHLPPQDRMQESVVEMQYPLAPAG